MTAVEIIQEIKHLPPEERAQVEDFIAKQARESRQLPGKELGRMAKTMVDSDDPDEKAALRAEITKGFYGT
jgi:Spy/CpxP family protein refolding chaperone